MINITWEEGKISTWTVVETPLWERVGQRQPKRPQLTEELLGHGWQRIWGVMGSLLVDALEEELG